MGRFLVEVVISRGKDGWGYLLVAVAAVLAARIMYNWSIERVLAWGDLVKAAFDCYLPALAKQLGYGLPGTGERRFAFWQAVSRAAIYNRRFEPADWPPADAAAVTAADTSRDGATNDAADNAEERHGDPEENPGGDSKEQQQAAARVDDQPAPIR